MARTLYRALWVLPVSAAPIENGAVLVDGETIAWVGSGEAPPADAVVDLGRAILMPGLVNVHSHLELTEMRGRLEPFGFHEWIKAVIRIKYQEYKPADFERAARAGAQECLRAGITCVADTGDSGAPVAAMSDTGLRGIYYQECFGPGPGDAEGSMLALSKKVRALVAKAGPRVKVGVSPHAPYTVSPNLFQLVTKWGIRDGLDVAIHAAESQAEVDLLRDNTGPFAEGLRSRGIPFRPRGVSPLQYLDGIGALEGGPLLIHCVQASDEDLATVAQRGARIAHCPRSNAKLGHGFAPLMGMRKAGIAVGLGSDSVASNNAMDLFTEMRDASLIARARERDGMVMTASETVEMATLGGAKVLRMEKDIGSLEAGKQADMCVLDLAEPHLWPCHDPVAAVAFATCARDVRMTLIGGDVVYERSAG